MGGIDARLKTANYGIETFPLKAFRGFLLQVQFFFYFSETPSEDGKNYNTDRSIESRLRIIRYYQGKRAEQASYII